MQQFSHFPIFLVPPLETRQLGIGEDCSRLPPPARLPEVAAEQGGEVEGGGGVEEEGVARIRLVNEGIGGEGQVGQVGRQGGVGRLSQAPSKASLLPKSNIICPYTLIHGATKKGIIINLFT